MKKVFCCFRGASSSQVVQDPQPQEPSEPSEPSQPSSVPSETTDSSETIDGGDGDLDEQQHPFGDNEFLNYAWLNNIEIPDDLYPQNSNPYGPPTRLSHFTFRWHEILHGTQNLLNTNLLGQGTFGEVYLCDFPRFDKVGAAKIQHLENAEAHTEFEAEIRTLHEANHPNVIKLLGQCVTPQHRVIVYEFMPRGSLDHHLYAETRPGGVLQQNYEVLNWERRMEIAVGVAEALIYLHDELKTTHRAVKVSNVLLDEGFVPKLTDFGLATKIVENVHGMEQQTEINSLKGAPGCIAPETEWLGAVSSKSDVYNYGVFLLTLITGRKDLDLETPAGARKLTEWLRKVWIRKEYTLLVVDVALANRFSVEGVIRLFQAARMCMDPQVLARPNMRVVKSMVRQAAGVSPGDEAFDIGSFIRRFCVGGFHCFHEKHIMYLDV